jgi:hypothetical protein
MIVALYELHPGEGEPTHTLRWLHTNPRDSELRLTGFWETRRQFYPHILDVLVTRSVWVLRNSMTGQRFSNQPKEGPDASPTQPQRSGNTA